MAAQCCPDLESPTFKHAQSQILLDCRPEDPPHHSESPKSQSRSPKHKPNISQASVKLSHSRHLATPNLKCAYLLCRAPVQSRVQRFQTHQLLLDLLHLATASHLPWIFRSYPCYPVQTVTLHHSCPIVLHAQVSLQRFDPNTFASSPVMICRKIWQP